MDIHIDISGAMKGMAAASEKVHRGIALYGQTAALKMEAYAKANRRWHDRTASARQTIKGISGWGYISADVRRQEFHCRRVRQYAVFAVSGILSFQIRRRSLDPLACRPCSDP